MNLNIIKIAENLDKFSDIFDVDSPCIIYVLKLGSITIGYGKINTSSDVDNRFEIYIIDEYRGNGYGKYFFNKMLEELKTMEYKEIELKFDKKNFIIKRLVEYNDGLRISQGKDIITYVIPID